ncbi:MAG: hypothetical protein H0T89_29760 [Deltaproteobacteria bacterium]|nr:hypothetical protein [Deltaproteobacteria bacterium]MDQ3297841.1 hypothetical protein [Myxococcota bacterium]
MTNTLPSRRPDSEPRADISNLVPFVRPSRPSGLLDHDRTIPRARIVLDEAPETLAPETLAPETLGPEPVDDVYAKTLQVEKLPAPEWAEYERVGLGPAKVASARLPKLVVSSYRLLGFAILTLIVAVLVGYIATTTFYFLNTTWVKPVVISANDEKVVTLRAELAAQENQRDRLAAELDETERAIAAHQLFQLEFARAIQTDLQGRQAALARVRSLARTAAATRTQIRQSTDAYAADHTSKMAQEYEAGLIDRSTLLGGKYQLAQITTSNLSLAERHADLRQRAAELAVETRALDALLANKSGGGLSYDVLKIKREYEESGRALHKATANRSLLQTALVRQDAIIAGLRQSSYLRAAADHATVALVPYENLAGVRAGTTVHACRLEMVVCREVGRVLEVLPGEVTFDHPHRDTTLRGQLVELRLTETAAAAEDVLFVGGAPLAL